MNAPEAGSKSGGAVRQFFRRGHPSPLFFIIPPAVARIAVLIKGFYAPEVPGNLLILLRGFGSDLAMGFMAGLAGYLFKRFKFVFWTLWIAWCLLAAFNMDHIAINDANLNYAHLSLLGNRLFLKGCVFTWRHSYHFALILSVSGMIAILLIWLRPAPQLTAQGLATAGALCLMIFLLSPSPLAPNWVLMNPLEENLRRALKTPHQPPVIHALEPEEMRAFYRRDLAGTPLFPYPARPQNILLVILENISFDTAFSPQMPFLAQLADRHISYGNFISLQRQSNRGLYALMCGDFPNFLGLEAKADLLVADPKQRTSLPGLLAARGYHTLFLQANETGFFQRDLFCRKVGFQKALGERDFPGSSDHKGWSVPDRTLFRQALREIDLLNRSARPWFVTLFTGGTHYPFTVPGVFSPSKVQAVTALDQGLKEFLEELEQRQALPDTLVIITADEAGESSGRGLQRELRMNHAPLVVLAPPAPGPLRPDGLFTQRDLLLSICDYLGLEGGEAGGRSIFRTYRDDRGVIFGNVYASKRYACLPGGKLYAYSMLSDQWTAYQAPPKGLFQSSLRPALPDGNDINLLERVFAFNEESFDKLRLQTLYHQADRAYTGPRKLMGSHRVSCKQGDRLVWRLALESPDPLEVRFRVTFRNTPVIYQDVAPPIIRQEKFPGGQPAIFSYEYTAPRDFDSVSTSIYVAPAGDRSYLVKELAMEQHRNTGGRPGGEK